MEKPKYELRILGIPIVVAFGSRNTIFGLGDKLNALPLFLNTNTNITANKLICIEFNARIFILICGFFFFVSLL